MKTINLSVNESEIHTKSKGSNKTGFKVKSFDLENPEDISRLKTLFQSNVYSNNKFGSPQTNEVKDGYTGHSLSKNYEGVFGIMLDYDDGILSLDEAREKFKDHIHIIHTSAGHQIDKPDKGGAVDRFRVFLPFQPQHDEEPYFCAKTEGSEFYAYLKSIYVDSDTSVFEKGRKFFPFAGEDRDLYEFHVNSDGEYISISSEDIRNISQNNNIARAALNRVPQRSLNGGPTDDNNRTKYNVTTGEPYYSPTGLECLMPDEDINAKLNGSEFESIKFQQLKELMEMNNLDKVITYCNHCDDRNSDSQAPGCTKITEAFT